MIKIAIVEDEKEMASALEKNVQQFFRDNKFEIEIAKFNNALDLLNSYKYDFDLIFMDINLPNLNGMEASKKIRQMDNSVMIIFVTSLAQYAITGYEVNAFDFILKPISYYNFVLKMQRALLVLKTKDKKTILVPYKTNFKKVEISNIMYIEVLDHKIIFHTTKENIESFDTLKKYEELLKDSGFALCNRSYLVNLKYVKEVDNNFAYIGDNKLLISRPRRKEFIKELNIYLGKGGEH